MPNLRLSDSEIRLMPDAWPRHVNPDYMRSQREYFDREIAKLKAKAAKPASPSATPRRDAAERALAVEAEYDAVMGGRGRR